MAIEPSVADDNEFKFSELFVSNSVMGAAVEQLCHYHPMGVYYYVGIGNAFPSSCLFPFRTMTNYQFAVVRRSISISYSSPR